MKNVLGLTVSRNVMNTRVVLLVNNKVDPSRAPQIMEPRFAMSNTTHPNFGYPKGVGSE